VSEGFAEVSVRRGRLDQCHGRRPVRRWLQAKRAPELPRTRLTGTDFR
jgi:hypothetical protein